jgi:hypothetical protein
MGQKRSWRLEKSHLIISTIAAFAMAVGFVVRGVINAPTGFVGLFNMAVWVSASIVIFYILGSFAKAFLVNNVFATPETENLEEVESELNTEFMEETPQGEFYEDEMYDDAMLETAIYSE